MNTQIEVTCYECGKTFKTSQEWFDKRNKEGKLPCRKCRFAKFPPKKEKIVNVVEEAKCLETT